MNEFTGVQHLIVLIDLRIWDEG